VDNEKKSRTTAQSIIIIENYNNVVRNTMEPTKTRKEWLSLETSLEDELAEYWGGDWGCDSEVGTLKAVLLRRPGKLIWYITFEVYRERCRSSVRILNVSILYSFKAKKKARRNRFYRSIRVG